MIQRIIFHDPRELVRGLKQILISDAKTIGFLFGAGTSMAQKPGSRFNSRIPGVEEMTNKIVDSFKSEKYKKAFSLIKVELMNQSIPWNIEQVLSSIIQKEAVVGNEKLCGLKKNDFIKIKESIEKQIVEFVSVHKDNSNIASDLIHCDFAKWIANAQRKHPIEIFTTNYDYLIELGLEEMSVNYSDGFVGSYRPYFSNDLVENPNYYLPRYTKLWKLHGSLGWYQNQFNNRIIRGSKSNSNIIIYPSLLKYQDSRKQPYISFMDRLSRFLSTDDSVLFILGYSFGDQHINDIILNMQNNKSTSYAIAFYYDKLSSEGKTLYGLNSGSDITKLCSRSSRLSVYGMRSAIIGGQFGEWKLKNEPSKDDSISVDSYFDEDAACPMDKDGVEHEWTGKGEFLLPDFYRFSQFLLNLSMDYYSRIGQ